MIMNKASENEKIFVKIMHSTKKQTNSNNSNNFPRTKHQKENNSVREKWKETVNGFYDVTKRRKNELYFNLWWRYMEQNFVSQNKTFSFIHIQLSYFGLAYFLQHSLFTRNSAQKYFTCKFLSVTIDMQKTWKFLFLRSLCCKVRKFLIASVWLEGVKFIAVSFMSNENKNSIPVRILPPHNFKLIKYLRDEGEKHEKTESEGR